MYYSIPEALEIKFSDIQKRKKSGARKTPLLPIKKFVKRDQEINITEEALVEMEKVLRSGVLGKKRMVTLAHPDDISSAPAVGWMLTHSAKVGAYEDTKALYIDIDWVGDMEEKISNKEYRYISPVFQENYKDETGEVHPWAMLFAGVTNNPHWTTQPGLWEEFTSSIEQNEKTIKQTNNKELQAMDTEKRVELEKKVISLTADNDVLKAKIDDLKTRLADKDEKVVEFTAATKDGEAKLIEMTKKIDEFKKEKAEREERDKKLAVEQVIQKFCDEGKIIKDKHLFDAEGKELPLNKLAYNDLETFSAVVENFEVVKIPTKAVGGSSGDNNVDVESKAHQMTIEYCDKNKCGNDFAKIYMAAEEAVKNGKTL